MNAEIDFKLNEIRSIIGVDTTLLLRQFNEVFSDQYGISDVAFSLILIGINALSLNFDQSFSLEHYDNFKQYFGKQFDIISAIGYLMLTYGNNNLISTFSKLNRRNEHGLNMYINEYLETKIKIFDNEIDNYINKRRKAWDTYKIDINNDIRRKKICRDKLIILKKDVDNFFQTVY